MALLRRVLCLGKSGSGAGTSVDWRLILGLAVVLSGCNGTPTLATTVSIGAGTLGPIPDGERSLVRTRAAAALQTVVEHERETGWPDDNIAWLAGGCVLVGWYEQYPMSFDPFPEPYPVYAVRLVNGASTTWVLVDARSGEERSVIGPQPALPCGSVGVEDQG